MRPLRRSTNERVLARHHSLSRRIPSSADPIDGDYGVLSANDPNPPALVPNLVTVVAAKSAPAIPVATVITPAKAVPTAAAAATPPLPTEPLSPTVLPDPVSISPTQPLSSSSSSLTTSLPIPSTTIIDSPTTNASSSASAAPETSPTGTTSSKSASHGISSGAIGGIVTVIVIMALLVVAFFVRKIYQRRRAIKRNTWGAGLVPSLETKRSTLYGQSGQPVSPYAIPEHERLANVPRTDMSQTPARLSVPPALATASSTEFKVPNIVAPASAYNSSPTVTPKSPFAPPSTPATVTSSATGPPTVGELAVVARTFIPTLPDELHISNAEHIHIISAFDDGWALCTNSRGEQGVVPLECLDRRGGGPTDMQLQPHSGIGPESNKASRRMSSLAPAAPGTY